MKKLLLLLIPTLISFYVSSCKENPVEHSTIEHEPGRRDYTWEIDTFASNQYYYDMWGYTANEIWIVGNGLESNRKIARYKEGEIDYLNNPHAIAPYAVFGFSKDAVFFHNNYDRMWQYDGNGFLYKPTSGTDKFGLTAFKDFWSYDYNIVYGCGARRNLAGDSLYGFISEYDGNQWNFTIPAIHNLQFNQIRKGRNSNTFYLLAFQTITGQPDSCFFYKFDNNNLSRLKLNTFYNYAKSICVMDGMVYLVDDKQVFKENEGKITLSKSFNSMDITSPKIFGRNEQDIFVRTTEGIGHYNGGDIKTLLNLENDVIIAEGLVFEKDVFFLAVHRDDMRYIVIHGALINK